MSSFTERSGSRIAMGIAGGAAAGLLFGSFLLWLPVGIVAGAIWEKKR